MSALEERIRKLLALADSPNENEAAAAAEKAQALMLRYGIELATIAAASGERLAVDEHVLDGKVDPWRRMLAAAVARSAGGRVVWAPDGYGRGHGRIFFYGLAGAVGAIVGLYRYLEAQLVVISATATATRRERRVHGRTWRSSFLLGAVGRLGRRLDARRAETTETGDNSRALVLVKTAVDRAIERRHRELQSSGYRRSVARGAYEAAATRAGTSISGSAGSGTARRRYRTRQRDERPPAVAGGAVPDVWRARRAALPDRPLQRHALAGADAQRASG